VSRKAGGKFTAFGGSIHGQNLLVIPGKRQLWRANHWKKQDSSILIMTFSHVAGGGQIDLVHVGVPDYDHRGVREGWPKYYWRPWKKSLAAVEKKKQSIRGSFDSEPQKAQLSAQDDNFNFAVKFSRRLRIGRFPGGRQGLLGFLPISFWAGSVNCIQWRHGRDSTRVHRATREWLCPRMFRAFRHLPE
jgi:hypothetical protein